MKTSGKSDGPRPKDRDAEVQAVLLALKIAAGSAAAMRLASRGVDLRRFEMDGIMSRLVDYVEQQVEERLTPLIRRSRELSKEDPQRAEAFLHVAKLFAAGLGCEAAEKAVKHEKGQGL